MYEAYHAQTLAEKVAAMLPSVTGWDAESALGRFKDEEAKAKLLADPLRLSYWLSSNLPLEDDDRYTYLFDMSTHLSPHVLMCGWVMIGRNYSSLTIRAYDYVDVSNISRRLGRCISVAQRVAPHSLANPAYLPFQAQTEWWAPM